MTAITAPAGDLVPATLALSGGLAFVLGENRREAILRALAFVWGVIVGFGGYLIIAVLVLIAIPDVLYQFITDRPGLGLDDKVYVWITAVTYWESDNYAYAFADHEHPSWLPDTERDR